MPRLVQLVFPSGIPFKCIQLTVLKEVPRHGAVSKRSAPTSNGGEGRLASWISTPLFARPPSLALCSFIRSRLSVLANFCFRRGRLVYPTFLTVLLVL